MKEKASKKAEKTEKKPKDPNAPKKPSGAYIHFCSDKRASIKEKNPDLGAADILKALGEKWRGLTDADKTKYNEMAEADKARYTKEMEAYEKKKAKA